MKTVHEFFTNTRMDGAIFVHSWFYSWMVSLIRVESLGGEAFDNGTLAPGASAGERKALIVMATETGKTRTTMGLIDVFMRSNQARVVYIVSYN
jgi:hypothetical protein